MAWLSTGVASSACCTTQAQCRAISLNMAQALAVVALLCLSCTWVWAAI
jgi:hypothetical protein